MLGYIDPGSGTLLLQMLIAGVVGAAAFFRHQIARIFGFFKPKKDDVHSDNVTAKK